MSDKFSLIFKNMDREKIFKEWFSAECGEDNFEERIGFDESEEEKIRQETLEELSFSKGISQDDVDESSKEFEKLFDKKKHDVIKDLAEDWFDSRTEDWVQEFEKVEITNEGIVCARAMTVPNMEEFLFHLLHGVPLEGYRGIGPYWSWDHDRAEAHWAKGDHKDEATVIALIPFSSIDIKTTIRLNLNVSLGEDEAEIRVKEGSPVYILKVNDEVLPERIQIVA